MANLGSLALGIGIVAGIGGLSFILRQNQSRQFNESDLLTSIRRIDFTFESELIALSQDARAALVLGKSGNLFVGKSFGDEFAIRAYETNKISHEFGFATLKFNDFTFPDFVAKFDPQTLEAINAKLLSA